MRHSARRAATAVEYGLIAGGILLAIILGVTHTGTSLANLFGGMSNSVSSAGVSTASVSYPGNAIPGVTGLNGTPSWITSACQALSNSALTTLTSEGTVPPGGPAFGCIPAGSIISSFNDSIGTAYYTQVTPGGVKSLIALTFQGQVFSYTGFSDNGNTASECVSGLYDGSPGPIYYPGGTYNAPNNTCQDSGLSGTTPASSFVQYQLRTQDYDGGVAVPLSTN